MSWWYPDVNDPDFHAKLQNKREFGSLLTASLASPSTKKGLAPHQKFVSRFLSPKTPYDSLLLFHALGSGKTCSAISIGENFPKVLVLVKNQTIASNFKQELFSEFCTQNKYITAPERKMLQSPETSLETRKIIIQGAQQRFKNKYEFMTFGVLVNRVLGTTQPGTTASASLDPDLESLSASGPGSGRRRITGGGKISSISNRLVIIDEFHNITGNEVYNALTEVLAQSYNVKLLLMSATPVFDNLSELPFVVNLLSHPKGYPLEQSQGFIKKVVGTEGIQEGDVYRLTSFGRESVARLLQGRVSYVGIGANASAFPRRINMGIPLFPERKYSISIVPCPMSEYQTRVYLSVTEKEKKGSRSVAWKESSDAATMTYPDGMYGIKGFQKVTTASRKGRASSLLPQSNQRSSLKREYQSVFGPELRKYSSKLFQLIENIKSFPGNCFVYSQFVSGSGLAAVQFALDQHGLGGQYKVIDGSVSEESRKRILRQFNSPENANGSKIRILLGSPAISEGITLKNVRQIHIIEPAWNMSRLEQVIGRGIRTNSHIALPESERNVRVFRYVATIPKRETVDEYKYRICEEKDRAIKEFERILKQISIDCKYAASSHSPGDNFSPECDYTLCNYGCPPGTLPNPDPKKSLNTGTYFSHISNTEVVKCMQELKKLFALQPYYSLKELTSALGSFEDLVVYKALHELIRTKDVFENIKGHKGFVVYRNGYYFFNPQNVPSQSSLYRKTHPKDSGPGSTAGALNPDALTNLLSKLDSKLGGQTRPAAVKEVRRPQPSPRSGGAGGDVVTDSPLYGTIDKDNKFRIVDNRNAPQNQDKRRQKRGSVCNSSGFTTADLESIYAFVTGSPPVKMTKTQMCNAIETELRRQNKIVYIE